MADPSSTIHESIAELFGVLHDGVVTRADIGSDTVTFVVRIGYVAERLLPPAEGFTIVLRGVENFRYFPWANAGEAPREPVAADEVLGAGVDVLEGKTEDGMVVVTVLRSGRVETDAGGDLRFSATALELHDDNGITRTVGELRETARSYWDEWSAKNAAPKG